jgi:hypothetical protein
MRQLKVLAFTSHVWASSGKKFYLYIIGSPKDASSSEHYMAIVSTGGVNSELTGNNVEANGRVLI